MKKLITFVILFISALSFPSLATAQQTAGEIGTADGLNPNLALIQAEFDKVIFPVSLAPGITFESCRVWQTNVVMVLGLSDEVSNQLMNTPGLAEKMGENLAKSLAQSLVDVKDIFFNEHINIILVFKNTDTGQKLASYTYTPYDIFGKP